MNIDKIYKKYEEIECDLYDLMEGMKYWECPDLIVKEKEIPEDLKLVEVFEKKDVAPLNGGNNSRLHEYIVEYYLHDDENELNPNEFIPLVPKKFVTYQKENYFPGLTKITLIFGQKIRKENDWRFTDKINVQKDEAYFLYDYSNQQYKQVNPKKDEWIDRMYERELIRKEAVKFILFYRELKDVIWIKKQNPFDPSLFLYQFSSEINEMDQKTFIETMNFFLTLSQKYIYILSFFGSITQQQFQYLLKAIEKQQERQYRCYEYIILEEENLIYELKEILNLPNNHPFADTRYKMERLLMPRKERIEDINAYNYMEGYVFIDAEGEGCCYPNLSEITRKLSLYNMAGNEESEKEIEKRIIGIAKRQIDKK
ncbi:hypothetical protein [Neobacillus sp. D3-1R]|uniref:hypothetical protein n=1 Tax=Neobacillus sp. D3-1R TaxID=3445778 RepID=UPI003FA12986